MPTTKSAGNGTARKTASEKMPDSKFHELFMDELKDIYWAEKNLVKALPKMQKAATSEELSTCIGNHLEETKEHVARLEQVFELLGKKPQAKKCEAMEGLIAEGQEVVADTDEDTAVRDAGIIIASQKIEHYEISAYGSLRTLANVMGHSQVAKLLEQTLKEEKNADSLLTEVAESTVNEEAAAE
ncbi:YciE/YciF ferroxidase family protein [Chitinophaga ginsengisegetis]|uniref:YciE/YciF ferroxidase family protein n=1 Tax=Chitinophaga ginsengisegetis TaxID=393003 RepID=UPI000DB90BAF|nr:ferritin-like domain-containing protein [Chitinophaga ginsengisegetis]MDR6566450.1 ferritin-like metal-binding protein YciE [Chitinophaga ginsengisegetis]MDR6646180.1 ferritin-like metal-binding protein YciE [Chitinophaga ginsengisegetis]MDR6651228.1 ferritin-like metal-binding protein YciE [Chitinophaga ginsengisegetis]